MIQLTETAIGKVKEILDTPGAEAGWTADLRRRRRMLGIQLLDGLREHPGHAGQDLQATTA